MTNHSLALVGILLGLPLTIGVVFSLISLGEILGRWLLGVGIDR
ncbi:MAG: hypothetical protein ACO4CG_01405 [Prochlorothrix sp.]|nr:hypothetical protein [Prochlorothrix sp.]